MSISDGRRDRVAKARRNLATRHAAEPERVKRFDARMARLADVRRRNAGSPAKWCILRTAARSTVALIDALERDGFTVWSPCAVKRGRAGRSRAAIEKVTPMLHSFVFADATRVNDLLVASNDPTRRYPDFTVFLHRGNVPLIADRELATLWSHEQAAAAETAERRDQERLAREKAEREAMLTTERERKEAMRRSAPPMPVGKAVLLPGAAFAGVSGIVVKSRGNTSYVLINGGPEVKIDTFLLRADVL